MLATTAEDEHGEQRATIDAAPVKDGGGETVFHPSWQTRRVVAFWLFAFIVAAVISFAISGIRLRPLPSAPTLLAALLYPLFMATMLTWTRALRGTSLVAGPAGLVYATPTSRTIVAWRDVEKAGKRPGPGRWLLGEGLILRTPPGEPPEWRWRLLAWRSFPIRFIPLDQFGTDWRDGAIGMAIRKHVPSMLAALDER